MGSGRHASYEEIDVEFSWSRVPKFVWLIVILAIIVGVVLFIKQDKKEVTPAVSSTSGAQNDQYTTLGKIKIDKIEVEQPILDTREDEALEKGVIKLYGGNLNEEGNFCIAGHNYDGIFGKLNELQTGDEFQIINPQNQESTYQIVDITTVEPTNLDILKPQENSTQITLITCEDFSTQRLIVTAELVV